MSDPVDAEQWLWRALRASDPQLRIASAQSGLELLEGEASPDTHFLLLRQVYLGHLELRQLRRAVEVAALMATIGPMRDVALHDKARAHGAAGERGPAIEAQRLAARAAPPARRSFQLWSLATLQHFDGDLEGALATLRRALRHAKKDRPLLKAHEAFVLLSAGKPPSGLAGTVATLRRSRCREGYGQYLLGMIAYHMGDTPLAAVHLRAFLTRNARLDVAKELTLREELRRARTALAKIESE